MTTATAIEQDAYAAAFERLAAGRQTEPGELAELRRRAMERFTALGFSAPERVRVQYRLLGNGSDWIECVGPREARYSYLKPGEYELRAYHNGKPVGDPLKIAMRPGPETQTVGQLKLAQPKGKKKKDDDKDKKDDGDKEPEKKE